jgi:lipoprotein NlpD
MRARDRILGSIAAYAGIAIFLGGCVVSPTHEAPIVDHSQAGPAIDKPQPSPAQPEPGTPPQAREAHNGQYVAQAGDTLYSIALAFGQDHRDIARWNGLDETAQVRVGQVLRVAPPAGDDAGAPVAEAVPVPVSPSSAVETRSLAPAETAAPAPGAPPVEAGTAAPGAAAAPPAAAAVPPAAAAAPPDKAPDVQPEAVWAWPSSGKLLERFDETSKGIDIGGNVGDPVTAANDGQVVYSGNGLRGYGKLVIIKHTDEFVSAYAHNNEVLVTQGQAVKRGQHIADLGMTDAPTPRLHFEIRRRGKPVDPMTYLPSR